MKTLFALLASLALAVSVSRPAAAVPPPCTGAPVMTGSIGTKSAAAPNAEYITAIQKHPSIAYALTVSSNFGSTTVSFGSGAGIEILTGSDCFTSLGEYPAGTGDCPSVGYTGGAGQRITSVNMPLTFDGAGIPVTRVIINGTKVFELYGVSALGSFNTGTQQYFDGVARIRQDTGANSRLYFEGWNKVNNVWSWKSVGARFSNSCGSISLLERPREVLAGLYLPAPARAALWWEQLG